MKTIYNMNTNTKIFLKKILILNDNYVWILYDINNFCIILDPGLSAPIIKEINKKKWIPLAILLTHNHIDHIKGVKNILKYYPKISVFGPNKTRENCVHNIVEHGNKITLLNHEFYVFSTPGHTSNHISYYSHPYFFCGDTLFSGGCGNVYKNEYFEMYNSVNFIKSFRDDTVLCYSHEYTLNNLKFAQFILPEDENVQLHYKKIITSDSKLVPSCIYLEKKINLFLRTSENLLKKSIGLSSNHTSFETFVRLRMMKDCF